MTEQRKSAKAAFTRAANDNALGPARLTKTGLKRALSPPHDATSEIMHGTHVYDPFRPLEKFNNKDVVDWINRQNARFKRYIGIEKKLIEEIDEFFKEKKFHNAYDPPSRYNGRTFRLNDDTNALEVLERGGRAYKPIFDIEDVDSNDTLSIGEWLPSPDGKHVAVFLSGSSRWHDRMVVIDVESKMPLPEEMRFNSTLSWDKDGGGYQYVGNRRDPRSGKYHRHLFHHVLYTSSRQDEIIIRDITRDAAPFSLPTHRYDWLTQDLALSAGPKSLSFRLSGTDDAFTKLADGKSAELRPFHEQADGRVLAIATDTGASYGRIVSFDPRVPGDMRTLVPAQEGFTIREAVMRAGKMVLLGMRPTGTHDLSVFETDGAHLHDAPLPPLSTVQIIHDTNEAQGALRLQISGLTSEADFRTYNVKSNKLSAPRKTFSNVRLDAEDYIVEKLEAVSKDGSKVPMTLVRRKDVALDGTAAVWMTGYGGFRLNQSPTLSHLKLHFVQSGGIFVQTNLRGGGENGQEWYRQGLRLKKQNVFDDFIACAEKLIAEKYTSPCRLAIVGGSNGGLLTAAAALQRPDLFGAVVSQVPVTDVIRPGKSWWRADYGEADKVRRDFNAAAAYSPLQNIKPGAKYPPMLIETGLKDSTVPPWHAMKFAATMQAVSHPGNKIFLRVEAKGGHSGGNSTEYAQRIAFLTRVMGPIDQKAYKASLAAAKTPTVAPKGPQAA